MLFKRNGSKSSSAQAEQPFALQTTPADELKEKFVGMYDEYIPLAEALAVAVTVHVLGFPLMWFIGWALPWPGSPVVVTVIEINLEHWPKVAVPEKVTDIYTSHMHKYED